MDAIVTEALTKSYDGACYALKNLTVSVPYGCVYGFLGRNGAGKTTTVKLATGLLRPDGGVCLTGGVNAGEEPHRVHALCGAVTETARLYGALSGEQNLRFFGEVCGMEPEAAARRAAALLKRLDLWSARGKRARAYSTGMMQRLSLARALMHAPRILFLDEPTSGLDPESSQAVNDMIRDLARREGAAVFLCTHQLRYAQDLCETFGILDKGELLAGGTLEELAKRAGCRFRAAFRLREGEALEGFEDQSGWQTCGVSGEQEMPGLLRRVIESGHDVFEARLTRPSLEEVYFALTGGAPGAAGRTEQMTLYGGGGKSNEVV